MRRLVSFFGVFGLMPILCWGQLDTSFRVHAGLMIGQNAGALGEIIELINDDFLDDSEKDRFLNQLPQNTRAGVFSTIEVSVPVKGLSVYVGTQQLQSIQFSDDLANLALKGNAHRINEWWDLGSSGVELNRMSWLGLEKQWVTPQLNLTAGLGLYTGHQAFRWRGQNTHLYSDSTAAFALLTGANSWQKVSSNPLAGLGLGLSIDAKWKSADRGWKADVSVRHLGAMLWFNGPESGQLMGSDTLSFTGIFIDNIIQWDPEENELMDSLKSQYTSRDSTAFLQSLNSPLRFSLYREISSWVVGVRAEYITQSLMQPRTGIVLQKDLGRGNQWIEAFVYSGGFEPWGIQLAYSIEKENWSGTLHAQQIQSLISSQMRGGGLWLTFRKKLHP